MTDTVIPIHPEMLGTCPLPKTQYDRVLLGHGSGGSLTADLIHKLFVPAFGNDVLSALEDQATVRIPGSAELKVLSAEKNGNGSGLHSARSTQHSTLSSPSPRIAFTTDSFVIRPLFFPGGDIGSLAVHGTVNDLSVGGAKPLFLSAAFILEEGLPMADLKRIVESMRRACDEAGVALVTGDTKVVDRGKGDQIFITTSGIGVVPEGRNLSISNARPGDRIIVSGTIGDHGIAIMSVREGIEFETVLESDCTSLNDLTEVMLDACPSIRCMRDPTRGGISSALNELADASAVGVRLTESTLPVRKEVKAACEMLGLDPLYVANEGKLVAVVPAEDAERLLNVMRGHQKGKNAALIGEVVDQHAGMVVLRSLVGGERVVTLLAGEQLPEFVDLVFRLHWFLLT